jgi:ornithine cyclodeaminase/alanine dehydrogenase-like protein (mu-crystallin family)
MLLLSESAVQASLSIREAIHVNGQAFLATAIDGVAHVPSYAGISAPAKLSSDDGGNVATLFKPALLEEALGVKVVAVRPTNEALGLPTVPAVILLNDRSTGFPIALLQATYLTALRTAAGSGVATDCFARRDASVLSVFGAGMQARAHVQAVLSVRSIQHVHILNRSAGRAEELATALRTEFPAVAFTVHTSSDSSAEAVSARSAAVRSSHVICTATNSSTPLLQLSDVSPGTHINAVGSYLPYMHELSADLIVRCRIAIDSKSALHSGDLATRVAAGLISEESLIPLGTCLDPARFSTPLKNDSGEVGFTLRVPAGFSPRSLRSSSEDITLFKSVGIAIQDVATAYAVLQRARAQNRGKVAEWD